MLCNVLRHYFPAGTLSTRSWHEIEQWQWTIVILDQIMAVLRSLCWLAQTSEDVDKTFPFLVTLGLGFTLFVYFRDYLKIYVDLNKI